VGVFAPHPPCGALRRVIFPANCGANWGARKYNFMSIIDIKVLICMQGHRGVCEVVIVRVLHGWGKRDPPQNNYPTQLVVIDLHKIYL